jgi:AcrR family transcriptional regulator
MITRTARPTRMSAPDRRDQILDATQAIVDEQGFHALSIEAVARRAGISRPVVYEHFGDLAGLLEALTGWPSGPGPSWRRCCRPTSTATIPPGRC